MKITRKQLRRIIKEEISRVIAEVDVINRDSGEVLTLPPEFENEYADDSEIDDASFETLRDRIYSLRSAETPELQDDEDIASSQDDEDIASSQVDDTASSQAEDSRISAAIEKLHTQARIAMDDYMTDNPDIMFQHPSDIALDLAASLKWDVPRSEWLAAVKYYDGNEKTLINALAETMVG